MSGIPRALRAGVLTGVALGLGLGLTTAVSNDFRSFPDVLRLYLALALVFGGLLGLGGLAWGLLERARRRPADGVGRRAFAAVAAGTFGIWLARAFEFRFAYPARWPVDGFGGMLAVATAFLILDALLVVGLAVAIARGVKRLRFGSGAAALGLGGFALVSAAAFGWRAAPPEAANADAMSPVAPNERRVLLVGCDGMDWNVVDALLEEGELPAVRDLLARGVRAPLRTLPDVPSPALWTSLATSRTPEDTGIADFYTQRVFGADTPVRAFPRHFGLNGGLLLRDVFGRSLVRVTPVTADMVRARPVWSILADAGVRVGVANWLVTWPVPPGELTWAFSERTWGLLADDPEVPADGLWDPPELEARFPEPWPETEDAFVAAVAEAALLARETQVTVAYFRDVDAAEHLAWDEWEPRFFRDRSDRPARRGPVREAYVAFDAHLSRLLDAAGPDVNVVLVSDHGHHAWFTWFGRGTPGGHTDAPDGVFLAAGPAVRPDARVAPSIYDVTPTLLALVGLPASVDMRGDVLDDLLVPDVPRLPRIASWGPPRRPATAAGTAEPDEALLERLRALGYVR